MIDERTELLINRKLDGELSADESLELDRLVIRSPEARRLLDEYTHNDDLAVAALRTILDERPATRANQERRVRQSSVWRVLQTGGLAAAVLIAIFAAGFPTGSRTQHRQPADVPMVADVPGFSAIPVSAAAMPEMSQLFDGPRREKQRLVRDVLGVVDPETYSIYLLEVDNRNTTVEPDVLVY